MSSMVTVVLRSIVLLALASFCRFARGEDAIIFADDFADVKGRAIAQTDGKIELFGEAATRRVLPFMGTSPQATGKLTIVALEDSVTKGFDEKPGVLAISFKSVPSVATYCGFAYLGGVTPDRALQLREVSEAPNRESLKRIKLKFRYKAANPVDVAALGATYDCRLEPLVENSYASRIALRLIQAADKWQTFESTLAQGENIENFLKSVSTMAPRGYKIIWSQNGSITSYQVGDTLLIDDVEFSRVSP